MKTAVVLVMHGVPPKDFPRREISELMGLHARLENPHMPPGEREALAERFGELDQKVRSWPRSNFHSSARPRRRKPGATKQAGCATRCWASTWSA